MPIARPAARLRRSMDGRFMRAWMHGRRERRLTIDEGTDQLAIRD